MQRPSLRLFAAALRERSRIDRIMQVAFYSRFEAGQGESGAGCVDRCGHEMAPR